MAQCPLDRTRRPRTLRDVVDIAEQLALEAYDASKADLTWQVIAADRQRLFPAEATLDV